MLVQEFNSDATGNQMKCLALAPLLALGVAGSAMASASSTTLETTHRDSTVITRTQSDPKGDVYCEKVHPKSPEVDITRVRYIYREKKSLTVNVTRNATTSKVKPSFELDIANRPGYHVRAFNQFEKIGPNRWSRTISYADLPQGNHNIRMVALDYYTTIDRYCEDTSDNIKASF